MLYFIIFIQLSVMAIEMYRTNNYSYTLINKHVLILIDSIAFFSLF